MFDLSCFAAGNRIRGTPCAEAVSVPDWRVFPVQIPAIPDFQTQTSQIKRGEGDPEDPVPGFSLSDTLSRSGGLSENISMNVEMLSKATRLPNRLKCP